jgi:hypothetical protein
MCRLFWNLGASSSWKLLALSRDVMVLLYLYLLVAECRHRVGTREVGSGQKDNLAIGRGSISKYTSLGCTRRERCQLHCLSRSVNPLAAELLQIDVVLTSANKQTATEGISIIRILRWFASQELSSYFHQNTLTFAHCNDIASKVNSRQSLLGRPIEFGARGEGGRDRGYGGGREFSMRDLKDKMW